MIGTCAACDPSSSEETAPALSQTHTAADHAPSGSASVPEPAASSESALPRPDLPIVDLGGTATLPGPIDANAASVAALRWKTAVHERPDRESNILGFLRAGAIVATKPDGAADGKGCSQRWVPIEPSGFVCLGSDVTDDRDHPIVRASARRPDFAHRLPYMYGTVTRGGPVYSGLPSAKDLKKYEPSLKKHLRKWKDDEESGARYGLDVWLRYTDRKDVPTALDALRDGVTDPDIPWFLKDGGRVPKLPDFRDSGDALKVGQVNRRQGRSFLYSFLSEGRRYNVTTDLAVIAADRFRPIRGSAFHGWRVDKELEFPFALIRRPGARKWQWNGKKMVDNGVLTWRSAVPLTDDKRFYKKRLYYKSKEGFYVDDRHASRVDPAKRWPKWAQQGAKWIDINLTKQVLVAYEGQKMVYATLISSGEAGLADPEESTATIRGIFRIHTKWVSSMMDSTVVGEEFELRDVPYVQYFQDGFALHGAYWHDRFGRPKSHGCINLAPEDARRLFFWTEPSVPPGWHGARESLTGTIVFIHA